MTAERFVTPDREASVTSADGTNLYVTHFIPRVPVRFALVAVHGFAAYSAPYGRFFRSLTQAGIAVTAFDCRGHGKSSGRRGFVDRFSRYHDDLDAVIAASQDVFPKAPRVLMGHSHGGTIVLDAVLEGRVAPDRLVLAAPWIALFMKPAAWKPLLAGVMSRIWPTFAADNELAGENVSTNPDVIANFHKDPLIHHVATARWYTQVLATQARIRAKAAQLAVPTLLLSAGTDRIVDGSAIDALAAASTFIQRKHYPGLYHELFLEPTWEQVAADIVTWLV